MADAILKEIFGDIVENFSETIQNAELIGCDIDIENRELAAKCRFDSYVSRADLWSLEAAITSGVRLKEAKIEAYFSKDCYCPEAAMDIATELKSEQAVLNGYFNDAVFTVSDGKDKNSCTNIELKFGGYDTIKGCNFEREFCRRVAARFELEAEVSFSGQLENVQMVEPEYKQEPIKYTPQEPSPSQSYSGGGEKKPSAPRKVTGLVVPEDSSLIADSIEQIYGKKIGGNVINLENLSPDEECVVWGEVFFSELVPTKSGKGHRVKFQMYDGTNSVTVKTVVSNAQAETLGDALKKGKCVVVGGIYKMDEWEKDYVFEPSGIATAKKQGGRKDTSEEKRIELHLHTSMSQMDAVAPVKNVIKQAFKWGHKAVAITDHGVVQAFPDAMSAVDEVRQE